jgi:hypothetical protein
VCLIEVAEEKKDLSLCDKIADTIFKDMCIQAVAVAKKDVSACSKCSSSFERDKCIVGVAVAKKDAVLCGTVKDKIYWEEGCYKDVGIAAQDVTVCMKIEADYSGEELIRECLENISLTKLSTAICSKVTDEEFRDYNCLRPIAVAKGDVSICDPMTDPGREGACISAVAIKLADVSLCDRIQTQFSGYSDISQFRDCVTEVAKVLKKKSLCDRIKDRYAKESCQSQVP